MEPSINLLQEMRGILENAWSLAMLEKQARSAIGVIPFVGAGLSKPLGFPLWAEFLLEQGELAKISERMRSRIQRGEYEEAADDLQEARGVRRFEDAISASFEGGESRVGQAQYAVDLLPSLTAGPVITTNFDPVLERVF